MSKRTNAVMVRLDDAQMEELNHVASVVGIAASTLAHNAVIALLRSYDEHGRLTFPMRMMANALPRPEGEVLLNEGDDSGPDTTQPAVRKAAKPRRGRR